MLRQHRFGALLRLLTVDIQPQHTTLQGAARPGQVGVFGLNRMHAGRRLLRRGLVLVRVRAGRGAVMRSGLWADFGGVAWHGGNLVLRNPAAPNCAFPGWMRQKGMSVSGGGKRTCRRQAERPDRRYAVRTT